MTEFTHIAKTSFKITLSMTVLPEMRFLKALYIKQSLTVSMIAYKIKQPKMTLADAAFSTQEIMKRLTKVGDLFLKVKRYIVLIISKLKNKYQEVMEVKLES